jgi:predicted nuclease of predicted toxin-antitoxin system
VISFHLDESVNNAIAIGLRQRGIDVTTSREAGLISASDEDQIQHTHNHNRVLITHDDDFLRLHHQGFQHAGIAYCRPQHRSIGQILQSLVALWRTYETEDLRNEVVFL